MPDSDQRVLGASYISSLGPFHRARGSPQEPAIDPLPEATRRRRAGAPHRLGERLGEDLTCPRTGQEFKQVDDDTLIEINPPRRGLTK